MKMPKQKALKFAFFFLEKPGIVFSFLKRTNETDTYKFPTKVLPRSPTISMYLSKLLSPFDGCFDLTQTIYDFYYS
jgi:hypothetical protein